MLPILLRIFRTQYVTFEQKWLAVLLLNLESSIQKYDILLSYGSKGEFKGCRPPPPFWNTILNERPMGRRRVTKKSKGSPLPVGEAKFATVWLSHMLQRQVALLPGHISCTTHFRVNFIGQLERFESCEVQRQHQVSTD